MSEPKISFTSLFVYMGISFSLIWFGIMNGNDLCRSVVYIIGTYTTLVIASDFDKWWLSYLKVYHQDIFGSVYLLIAFMGTVVECTIYALFQEYYMVSISLFVLGAYVVAYRKIMKIEAEIADDKENKD